MAQDAKVGVPVSYQLPATGPLPQTYRVTLAIVDARRPEWIISQFAAGVVRTVTKENGGKFTESWDGLDDNFMPVPPGTYGLKGIYMPAAKWEVDGEVHSITPRYITSAEPWRALPGENKPPIVVGDPVDSPIGDVDVAANGVAVFCYQYLENARNFYMADLRKPIDYAQATPGYNSGGAAGGRVVATDGITAWCGENEGFVFRTDGKRFGTQDGRFRKGVHLPEGKVTALAAWRDEAGGKSFVYLAERGRLERDEKHWYSPTESTTDLINKIVVLDGETAERVAEVAVAGPRGVVARWGDKLWVLHQEGQGFAVSAAPLKGGVPAPALQRVLAVPAEVTPTDLEVDSHGRIYLADAKANKVYQYSPAGKPLRTFGRLAVQKPASYDPESFMAPEKISSWRDAEGHDRLIVMEREGPDRLSEWNPEDGRLLREWPSALTYANTGYAVDPRQPDRIYIQGHGGWLMRYQVNYETGAWKPEAVWPNVANEKFQQRHFSFPRLYYHGDTRYLAWSRGDFIYREAGDRWLASAGILIEGEGKDRQTYLWRDENGDGQVQESEYRPHPMTPPPGTQRYWGDSWLDDLSIVAIQQGTADIWRLAPESFDAHGNPIYAADGWKKLLTDPVLEGRQKGTLPATLGGNEIGDRFSSAWAMVAGSLKDGFFVNARGPDIGANFGAQQKLSRYVPDGKGGYRLAWRVGRVALHGTADEGEVYGSINVQAPIGGLVTQVDQSRMGLVLYTEEGLYVETLFPDSRRNGKAAGPYNLPGEFFTGYAYANASNGKVYFALGKTTPAIFEAEHWTTTENPVRRVETLPKTVSITASQIATAPEFALAVRKQRGGGTTARVALFAPMPGGGPALDGSLNGWEICEPVKYSAGEKQTVEVLCGFDPQNLYLRWHVRMGGKFVPKTLEPAERLFTHDRESDTTSFYLQGDPAAPPARDGNGRPGDVRLVFGLFQDKTAARPAVLGMYPQWTGLGKASPLTYRTPAGGAATFQHVGLVTAAKLGSAMDPDGEGYVIAAAIPRTSVPKFPAFTGEFRTQVNFDATFAGHNRFWWSNADGSASRETYDEPTEARLYPGSWAQAKFEPMSAVPIRSWMAIGPFGFPKLVELRHGPDRPEIIRTLGALSFPPEQGIDLTATYTGDVARTRKAARTLRWKPANISGDRVTLESVTGWKGYEDEGTAYLVTWIQSPRPAQVNLRVLDEHGHHAVRGWLNDEALPIQFEKNQSLKDLHFGIDPARPVALRAGWNKLLLRYDHVWGGNNIGLTVDASPEVLWSLKFTGTPPLSASLPAAAK